jgi:hypothetical protein
LGHENARYDEAKRGAYGADDGLRQSCFDVPGVHRLRKLGTNRRRKSNGLSLRGAERQGENVRKKRWNDSRVCTPNDVVPQWLFKG